MGYKFGGNFCFVELSADINVGLARNETPHGMEKKPSKKDVAWSRANLCPDEVADIVINRFQLTANEKEEREYRYGADY